MKSYSYISIILLSLLLLADTATAQTLLDRDAIPVPTRKKRPKPMKQEISFGLRLNTDGWGVFLDRGKVKEPDRTTDYYYDLNFWQIELQEKKHPKEIKRSNTIASSADAAKPFIYGKTSNFYALKLGYGKRKRIAGRPSLNNEVESGSVSVHWVYLAGLSLGLEKPYYIDAYVNENGTFVQKTINYTDTTADAFITQQNIVGSSGFMEGIGQTKLVPGIHLKSALHFDFASSKKKKMAIETGVNAEFYTRGISMMANQKDTPFFVNAYVSFQLGKRWSQKK